ncbi:hypothetical protein CC77DRAFT_1011216 [Alternaria alternata]|uniref:Uncharacterized protein n=2 Tax=Alternaria sect. Alternaria TaxID=2499237 RepID=A0A177DFF9_ALTAL|nr:hypothetical protein CC77DRAFT_1011216 [Alternaria alternata]KAH6862524.1 hypothetical protein B0T12DRAFT_470692 [Alternaria alternata]OAG17991.1 hypothetical protein CC77DRAFT_1011216 [Alternaria alternata]
MVVPLCRLRTWVSLARAPRVRRCDAMGAVTATHGAPARWMRLAGWARLMSVCHDCDSASEPMLPSRPVLVKVSQQGHRTTSAIGPCNRRLTNGRAVHVLFLFTVPAYASSVLPLPSWMPENHQARTATAQCAWTMIGGPRSISMGCVIQDTVAQWGLNQRRGSRCPALAQETNREVPSEPELSGGGWKPE